MNYSILPAGDPSGLWEDVDNSFPGVDHIPPA